MVTLEADKTDETTVRPPRFIPNRRVWVVVLLSVIGVIGVRQMPLDLAVINIISLVLLCIGFGMLLLWFSCFSDYPTAVRWFPTVALIVAASISYSRYEVIGFDGSLKPKIVRRDVERHDELLAAAPVIAVSTPVDLNHTTPDDFPAFLGPNGNSAVRGLALNPDWQTNPPQLEWTRDIGAGWSGFAVVNGYAVTMEQRGPMEIVACYQVDDGKPCWSHAIETRHETIFGYVGPRATPTISNGRVYAMGATGFLRCLAGDTGEELWVRNLFQEYGFDQEKGEQAVAWGRSSSPLVHDEIVYIPVGGPVDGKHVTLLAMDAETGETKWESVGDQVSYASPTLLTVAGVQQIVSVNENNVAGYALEDGEELWSYPWPGKSNMNASVSQPHVYNHDFVFLSKGYGHGAALIELSVANDGGWNADTVWEARVLKTKFSNVAILDGVAYGLDDGILTAVDVETGERLWKKGRYEYGQILLVGSHLLVMSETGELVLVQASPEGHHEIARIQALEGQSWNTIAIYGDRVLVRNSEQAACYRIKLDGEAE